MARMAASSAHNFHAIQQLLRVEAMARALGFYVGVLGFSNAPWGDGAFTSVTRDEAGLYLSRQSQGKGEAWVWIGVADVDALHAELVAKGVAIRMAPTTYPHAREMHVADPDGNVLRFGSDPEQEQQ